MSEENKEVEKETEQTPDEKFFTQAEYNSVVQESMKRKKEIRELRQQLETFQSQKQEESKSVEEIGKYRRLVEDKEKEILTLKHLNSVRDELNKLGALDSRVAELAFSDAQKEDALGSKEELARYLADWKKQNSVYFKSDKPIGVTPKVPSAQIESKSVSNDEDKYNKFKEMSRAQKAALPKSEFEEYMKIGRMIAGKSFMPNKGE